MNSAISYANDCEKDVMLTYKNYLVARDNREHLSQFFSRLWLTSELDGFLVPDKHLLHNAKITKKRLSIHSQLRVGVATPSCQDKTASIKIELPTSGDTQYVEIGYVLDGNNWLIDNVTHQLQ